MLTHNTNKQTNPFSRLHMIFLPTFSGSASARRHAEKKSKYFQVCDCEGIQVFPDVVETLGGWHEDAAAIISRLVRQLASHTGKEADEQIKHLFQRLWVLVMHSSSRSPKTCR
jgi:hypothetical protein